MAATLRDYLQCEYDAKVVNIFNIFIFKYTYLIYLCIFKVKGDRKFDKDTVKGCCPRVPQQPNFSDCGIFVLQYCESFFEVSHFIIPFLGPLDVLWAGAWVSRFQLLQSIQGDKTCNASLSPTCSERQSQSPWLSNR